MTQENDLLSGIPAISAYINKTVKATTHLHERGLLPTFRMGRTVCARKSTLAAHFAKLEAEAGHVG